jgi:hypothetical protein
MHVSEHVMRDFSRRVFLKFASAGAATAAAATAVGSRAFANPPPPPGKKEQFLLDRITFGRNPEMVNEINTRGYTGFLNWQLQLPGETPIDDSMLFAPPNPPFPGGAAYLDNHDASLAWGLTPYQIIANPLYPYPGSKMWGHGPQLLMRGGWFGKHQLRWVMTDFLQNVHNTHILQNYGYAFWAPFLKNVIYENALGNYSTLVKKSGQGSSMLWYLGQPDSNATNPNQNYGRELMELHTIGVKTYTIGQTRYETFVEADVAEVAKILTGWDMVGWHILDGTESLTQALGDFRWTAALHAGGTKTVSNLGPPPAFAPKSYPGAFGAGQAEGEELMVDLCAHPLTSLHISKRLVQWFIGDDYQGAFYDAWLRTSVAFYLSGGDLKQTIKELFNETYIDQILPPTGSFNKVRRPANKVLNFIRGLEAHIDYSAEGSWFLQQGLMGQINGYWAAPNGYQPENAKWIGTMQPMVRFYFDALWGGTGFVDPSTGLAVTGNGLRVDDAVLATIFPNTAPLSSYAQLAADRLVGGFISAAELSVITTTLTTTPLLGDKRRWALFYVHVSPSYQYFV